MTSNNFKNTDNPCLDITFGDCSFSEGDIIETIEGLTRQECQASCYEYKCEVYHFDYSTDSEKSNCTLLNRNYLQDCENSGGPAVRKCCSFLIVRMSLIDTI